ESSRATVVLHDELALVATETKDGRWLVGRRPVHLEHRNFLLMLVLTVVTLGIWGLISVGSLTRSFLAAIRRVNHAVRRVVDVGDLVAMGPIPTYSGDELAELTHDFNRLLGELVGLAAMTQAVAAGDLTMRMEGRGDVSSAFASMLVQLHDVVAQIRETSVGLATAASEIHAATQEQETASEHLANGMRDVSRTMDSLATSATQIDGASKGVLENAERTLATTDEMARKIGELSERTKGISELLEVIRDVADRSDLLALNGSLESTRAGEAGRGFALVAAEMRRLAERVTGTVADVRELVVDIKASTATTVMATEQSRRLAENTAAAARRITAETQQQSADTTMASTNVREVANIIAQTSVATTQTRAAAEGLMMQADLLEQLVLKFELREGDAPAAAFAPEALRSAALAEAKRRFS
ncbi:MAG: methyl-accepting chemotaxis protein, partial [Myxococcales bacterium]|nr:methyl-accepting chemotaxis protein [Myxococcales bacterium]